MVASSTRAGIDLAQASVRPRALRPRSAPLALLECGSAPMARRAVVTVDRTTIVGRPADIVRIVTRRLLQLLLVDVDHEALLGPVVGQRRPWQRPVLVADAEETAEGHDGVAGAPAHLVDHDVLDVAKLFAGPIVDVRAVDFFGRDQGAVGDLGFVCHLRTPLLTGK